MLPPHPKRAGNRIDFGRIHHAMEKVAAHGGIMVVHGEDEDLVQFNYERFREEGRMDGSNLHLVHTKLSELLAFRRTIALARASGAAVYFVHTSAREGVEAIVEARGLGLPIYGETLHQYACFNAEYYKTPRGFCSHTYPSLKFPEDQAALWDGLVKDGLSTLATDEYPTSLALKLRGRTIEDVTGGNTGAEARIGIAYSEGVVKRGMSLPRFADITATNAARILGLYPAEGRDRPGQRCRSRPDRSGGEEDARPGGLPRERLQSVGGLVRDGLARDDAPAGEGHRGARQAPRQPRGRPSAHPPHRSRHPPPPRLLRRRSAVP